MISVVAFMVLSFFNGEQQPALDEVASLVSTMEALQAPVEDFWCEYEGSLRVKGLGVAGRKLGDDGLLDTFSGIFIHKNTGDVYCDSLHRSGSDGSLLRNTMVIRMKEKQAEEYDRRNDAPIGYASIKSTKEVHTWRLGCPGQIFLLDKIKRDVSDKQLEGSVSDIQLDGRPCKVLKIALKGVPDSLIFRYWIDLARGGHVVRMECYLPGKVLQSTMSITLSSYKLNGADIWMPTYGEYAGYSGVEDGKPVITKEPAGLQTIYVVDGTMAFNTHPGPETFTIKYKPGTRISDHLRQLNTEFGAQKIDAKPTKVEAEKMLKEQIAKAEQQKSELVVASDPEGFDWWPWTAWGMSAVVLVSLVALILQRRGR